MEETKDGTVDTNTEKRFGDETFPWEEWTVIDEGVGPEIHKISQCAKSSAASSESSYSDIDNTSDAEEVRECIQILSERILKECPSVRSSEESVYRRNDESDGVSVITESDVDEPGGNANDRESVVYENFTRAPPERAEVNADRILMKVLNIMIACSLVAVIGLGAGRILNADDNRPISTELDLVTIKMESSRLMEQMKELSGVKEILEEIKSSILREQRVSDAPKLQYPTEKTVTKLPYLKKQLNTLGSSMNKPDITLSERLQIFLRTICLVLKDIRQPNVDTEVIQATCDTHFLFTDLKNLQKLLNDVIDGMETSERSTHQRFLDNVEFQMNSMSDSLVSDLTRALDKLNVKNQRKLGKIRFKLNQRLCVLRNTLPSDSKLRESLEKNNTFFDNCNDIATKKSKEKWREASASLQPPKVKKKNSKKSDVPVIPNLNKRFRGFPLKSQNATSSDDTIDTRKCYHNNLPSSVHDAQDSENTCAMLLAPPRSKWKLNPKSLKIETERNQKDMRKKSAELWPGKILLEGDDREASNIWKKRMTKFQEFEKSKLHKTSVSSHEDDDIQTTKRQRYPSGEKSERKFNENDDIQRMKRRRHPNGEKNERKANEDDDIQSMKRQRYTNDKKDERKFNEDVDIQSIKRQRYPNDEKDKSNTNENDDIQTVKRRRYPNVEKNERKVNEGDDIQSMKRTEECLNKNKGSDAILSEPPITNPDRKYKRIYSANPTVYQAKKNVDKENNEFIVVERRDENSKVEGNWQFERSRIRDQLRNDDSTGNWYFDRVGNRKNSRMNCDGEHQDRRSGRLHP